MCWRMVHTLLLVRLLWPAYCSRNPEKSPDRKSLGSQVFSGIRKATGGIADRLEGEYPEDLPQPSLGNADDLGHPFMLSGRAKCEPEFGTDFLRDGFDTLGADGFGLT